MFPFDDVIMWIRVVYDWMSHCIALINVHRAFVIGWAKYKLGLLSALLHYGLTWTVEIVLVFQTALIVPFHSPNGRRMPAVMAVQGGCFGTYTVRHQRRGVLMFSLICVWTNGWVNTRDCRWFETPSRSLWRYCNNKGYCQLVYKALFEIDYERVQVVRGVSTNSPFFTAMIINLAAWQRWRLPWYQYLMSYFRAKAPTEPVSTY